MLTSMKDTFSIRDGKRTLIYRRIPTTPSGVCGTLIGYIKGQKTFWY